MTDRRSFLVPHTRRLATFSGLAVWAASVPGVALADAGTTMVVSLTVVPSCAVQSGPMAFGALESANPQGTAQAALTLACTPGTAYAVTMDQGLHGSRRMADERGEAFLDYEIFRDAAGTTRWGGTAAEAVSGIAPSGGAVALSAYGRIAARVAAPGQYRDVVTVMVQF